jgi:hypothetical protein
MRVKRLLVHTFLIFYNNSTMHFLAFTDELEWPESGRRGD